jgi:thymidylate synthase (FAD)
MFFPKIFGQFGEVKEKKMKSFAKYAMATFENMQCEMMNLYSDEMAGDFATKKKLTSAFRRFAPMGLATGIVATFNFRTLRHLIEIRTSIHAEEEIRLVIDQMVDFLKKDYPMLFDDYVGEDTGDNLIEYTSEYHKI